MTCRSSNVMGMTINCIHIFIVTGSFFYWCVMRPASLRFFLHSCIYLRILIISYLATFLGTNISFLCWCAVKQSINQLPFILLLIRHHFTALLPVSASGTSYTLPTVDALRRRSNVDRHFSLILPPWRTGRSTIHSVVWSLVFGAVS